MMTSLSLSSPPHCAGGGDKALLHEGGDNNNYQNGQFRHPVISLIWAKLRWLPWGNDDARNRKVIGQSDKFKWQWRLLLLLLLLLLTSS